VARRTRTRTLLCGDLFTQPGAEHAPLTRDDILEPSEAMRGELDYWAHSTGTRATLERLADLNPRTLADRLEGSPRLAAPESAMVR